MMLSRIKTTLALGSGILLLGLVSCNKVTDVPATEDTPSVVPVAHVSMQAQMGNATKATYDARKLSWQVGDQLLIYSNGKVNGTLVCTAVDGDGKGTFSGEVTDLAPASVNVYFLGNRTVASNDHITVDFSSQTGLAENLPAFILLKKTGIEYVDQGGGVYAPAAAVDMEALVSILELKLDYEGTPGYGTDGTDGLGAESVTITGLKNQITVNFADAKVTFDIINEGRTTVAPIPDASIADLPTRYAVYGKSYLMGVIPSAENTSITVRVNYFNYDYDLKKRLSTQLAMWTGVNWSAMAADTYYWTNWAGKNLVQANAKAGYDGIAVTGGENAYGKDRKNGYNGTDVK